MARISVGPGISFRLSAFPGTCTLTVRKVHAQVLVTSFAEPLPLDANLRAQGWWVGLRNEESDGMGWVGGGGGFLSVSNVKRSQVFPILLNCSHTSFPGVLTDLF